MNAGPPATIPVGPGGRLPAPGRLALVQAFVNTVDREHGGAAFTDAKGLAAWLAEHDLAPPRMRASREDLEHALAVREAFRALLRTNNGAPRDPAAEAVLSAAADRSELTVRFGPDGEAMLVPAGKGVAAAMGTLVAIAYDSMREGSWVRLKACVRDVCHWAFFDTSRNRTSTWCSMSICGSREKAKAYRRRQSGRSGPA